MPGNDAYKTSDVNNLLYSLFKEVTVQFNNETVSDPSNIYNYRYYMEKLCNLNKDITNIDLKPRDSTENYTKK